MTSATQVNGKFLQQPVSGVQRYANGILSELNNRVDVLASPVGRLASNYWEQTTLPKSLKEKGNPLLLNFCNTAPASYKNQIVTIHDMAVFTNSSWFQKPFAEYYKLLFKRLSKKAMHFVTVSEFSKGEMMEYLKIPGQQISVIHSSVGARFENVLAAKPRISDQEFVLMVGSHDPRKNFDWVIENGATHLEKQGYQIIVAGRKSKAFRQIEKSQKSNTYWIEDCSDSELKWLYQNAALVIHPSVYEGFSLVPLEAHVFEAKLLVSDIPAHREIIGKRAVYFDPSDINSLLTGIENGLNSAISIDPLPYSFENSARLWDELIADFSS